ncbi:hypothetical protein BDQ17DRAFT_1332974 [Cyathus striatus]|nr:hypothetical protein BDQ17DRAFT_1332974 [Cyathus striatus]
MYVLTHVQPFTPQHLYPYVIDLAVLLILHLRVDLGNNVGGEHGATMWKGVLRRRHVKGALGDDVGESVRQQFQTRVQLMKRFQVDLNRTGIEQIGWTCSQNESSWSLAGFHGLSGNSLKSVQIVHGIHGVRTEWGDRLYTL